MTRPSRRVADYAPSTLEFSAELVLAAAVEEAVVRFRMGERKARAKEAFGQVGRAALVRANAVVEAERHLLAAAQSADLILGRAR